MTCWPERGRDRECFRHHHAATGKRLTRAKKVLAGSKRLFDVTAPADFSARLPAVQRALYLLFNEGCHGATGETAVRVELCGEAMRLSALLLEHPLGATPVTYALAALMGLDAATFRRIRKRRGSHHLGASRGAPG